MSAAVEWAALAYTLGLSPYAPTARYGEGAGFRQLKRALGVPARPPPSLDHWLYGLRDGIEVLVLTFDEGSGSSRTSYTGVFARIDPPLFMGLNVCARGFLSRLFGGDRFVLGHAAADEYLDDGAFEPARAHALFRERFDLLDHLVGIAQNRTRLTLGDSIVGTSRAGTETSPALLGPDLQLVAYLAHQMATLGAAMPRTELELAHRAEWQRFADARGFTFDASRMKLTGKAGDTPMEIALDIERREVKTVVTARFPRAIDVGFTVMATDAPSFLQGLFTQDIIVGEKTFDDAFRVTGYPEERVRAVLARPTLITIMNQIRTRTRELQLNHQELFFRLPGATYNIAELDHVTHLAQHLSRDLFGEITAVGPYR